MGYFGPRTYRAKGLEGRAWRLKARGYKYYEIADLLGVSISKAVKGVKNYEQSDYFKRVIQKRGGTDYPRKHQPQRATAVSRTN